MKQLNNSLGADYRKILVHRISYFQRLKRAIMLKVLSGCSSYNLFVRVLDSFNVRFIDRKNPEATCKMSSSSEEIYV